MRLCALRGVLASSPEANQWVLHDPRAWLGIAFHRVMEFATRGAQAEEIVSAWDGAVQDAAKAAAGHALDRRFDSPERWPSYYLVRHRALASAAEVAKKRGSRNASTGPTLSSTIGRERQIATKDGRLVGRPDYFDGRTITEFKSSLPEPGWPGGEQIIDGYFRQLRLYAAIIADIEGRWPVHGRIIAASGQQRQVELIATECQAEAAAAVSALTQVEMKLSSHMAPQYLASPAPGSCGGCPFQLLCPAFWFWLESPEPKNLPTVSVLAVLDRIVNGQDSDLYTVAFQVQATSHFIPSQQSLALRRSVHGDLTGAQPGTKCRIVSAFIRPDARLRADLSTVVMAETDVPILTTA